MVGKERISWSSHCGSVGEKPSVVSMRMQLQSLASLSGLRIWHCHNASIGHRCGSDLMLLWLWHSLQLQL